MESYSAEVNTAFAIKRRKKIHYMFAELRDHIRRAGCGVEGDELKYISII